MMALPLLPGETVLWQAQPHWRAVACSVFHVRPAALYFAVLVIVGAATDRWHGLSSAETMVNALPLAGTAVAACALLLLLGWMTARTTAYTLTNRRVVLRYGMALPVTLALPLRVIGAVAVRVDHDHTGDIPLTLRPGERVGFLKLWPLARPWRFAPAQPMLRAVPQAGMVAALLSRTLAAAEHDARASMARSDAREDVPSMPEHVLQGGATLSDDVGLQCGADTYLNVVVAQSSLFGAQINLVAQNLPEQQNWVALYKSLGDLT